MDRQLMALAERAMLEKIGDPPSVALVLGSGWDILIGALSDPVRIPYAEVPGMTAGTVPGHAGEWIYARMGGRPVLVMSGRLHYYEGHGLARAVFPVRLMKRLGVKRLVLTNAAGAVNARFNVCDLMLITDHINLTGQNPLIGENDAEFGPRFPDMSEVYAKRLRAAAAAAAGEAGVLLREGVYAWFSGPSYETPAEIRMARALGADAVGMSTVPEAIVARHAGMEVLALSCLTNMAAGVLDEPLSHGEVIAAMQRATGGIRAFMEALVPKLFYF
jgi:purine-nucleoside phosphorylase